MFSRLSFMVNGEAIEFSAHELILIAQRVLDLRLQGLNDEAKVDLPDYAAVDAELDREFWQLTKNLSSTLERAYQVQPGKIFNFLHYAYRVCTEAPMFAYTIVTHPNNQSLLNYIKSKQKVGVGDLEINKRILIPIQFIQMKTVGQWLYMTKHLSDHYLDKKHLSGWWFKVGGRIVRLRNDVEDGALAKDNKQFYSSDHGTEDAIANSMKASIHRCIHNFTWHQPGGTYFMAFKFWLYFTLSGKDTRMLMQDFVERITDNLLSNPGACLELLRSLPRYSPPPEALPEPILPPEVLERRKAIFESTWMRAVFEHGGVVTIGIDKKTWLLRKFISELTDEIEENEGRGYYEKLLKRCLYLYSRPDIFCQYDELPEETIRKRQQAFNKAFKVLLLQHQAAFREEFISHMTDELVNQPQRSLSLLFFLTVRHRWQPQYSELKTWPDAAMWDVGSRGRLESPVFPGEHKPELTEEKHARYIKVFDDLTEQCRYVSQGIAKQMAIFMGSTLNPFHTQTEQLMISSSATQYKMMHVLFELAKAINHGQSEPLFRELVAYGEREGDTYQAFEKSLVRYFAAKGALNDQDLAKKVREILKGEASITEDLAFLPALTVAWFLSESARNSLTTLTSLMLLDLIEAGVVLPTGLPVEPNNWYSFRNALLNPHKRADTPGQIKDLYGHKINPDEFGGCHPMAHAGSVIQTQELPKEGVPLTIARQKEGHLIIHWLERMMLSLGEDVTKEYGIQEIRCLCHPEKESTELADLEDKKERVENNRRKDQGTIGAKRKKDPNADVSKYQKKVEDADQELDKLNKQINNLKDMLERKKQLKSEIQRRVIEPLLHMRLKSLEVLLAQTLPVNSPENSALSSRPDTSSVSEESISDESSSNFVPLRAIDFYIAESEWSAIDSESKSDTSGFAAGAANLDHMQRLMTAWISEDKELSAAIQASLEEYRAKKTGKPFQEIVNSFGLTLHDVPGDGNCFFHALLHQLETRNLGSIRTLNGNALTHEALRAIAVDALIRHNEDLINFTTDPDEYINHVSQDKAWADGVIIPILAKALEITIVLLNSEGSPVTRISGGNLGVVYLGYEVGLHFQSTTGDPSQKLQAIANTSIVQAPPMPIYAATAGIPTNGRSEEKSIS